MRFRQASKWWPALPVVAMILHIASPQVMAQAKTDPALCLTLKATGPFSDQHQFVRVND